MESEIVFHSKMKDSLSLITLKVYINEIYFVVSDLSVYGQEFSDLAKSLRK
jgi:hypothetical protein